MPELAYLSLGSNLGNRVKNLSDVLQRLAMAGTVQAVSSLYETEPVDVTDQPWFVNCVVALETDLPPRDLLKTLLGIEHAMGRQRTRAKGPRTIDIDILMYGESVVDEPGLQIPHPAMHQRRFVLEPMVEVAPDVVHPLFKKTMRELLAALPAGQSVSRGSKIPGGLC